MENAQRLRSCTSRRSSSVDPFTMKCRRLVFLMLRRSNLNFSLRDTTWHSMSRNCCFSTDATWSRFETLSVSNANMGDTWCEHQWGRLKKAEGRPAPAAGRRQRGRKTVCTSIASVSKLRNRMWFSTTFGGGDSLEGNPSKLISRDG